MNTIEIRKGVNIKAGDYLRRGEEPYAIVIEKIEEGDRPKIDYRGHDLERLTVHEITGRPAEHFQRDFERAEVISKADFEKLKKEFEAPVGEEREVEIIDDFQKSVRASRFDAAQSYLKNYFETVVLREPEKVSKYLELRKEIPSTRYRPCICLEDYDEQILQRFFNHLSDSFWKLIPKNQIAKVGKPRLLDDYEATLEDDKLKRLIGPFASKDSYHLSLLGINFDDRGITATNAQILLFLPKVKKGKKGVYCLTTKCFKENDGEQEVNQNFPNYRAVMPKKESKYTTFELEVEPLIQLIKTFHSIGFKPKDVLILNLKIGNKTAAFNAKEILLPCLETMRKLGHETVKIWFEAPDKALAVTPIKSTKEALIDLNSEIILAMPFFRGKTEKEVKESLVPGDIIFDTEKRTLAFHGSKHVIPFGKPPTNHKLKLAKAKAAAQEQRIRILELQKAA